MTRDLSNSIRSSLRQWRHYSSSAVLIRFTCFARINLEAFLGWTLSRARGLSVGQERASACGNDSVLWSNGQFVHRRGRKDSKFGKVILCRDQPRIPSVWPKMLRPLSRDWSSNPHLSAQRRCHFSSL